MKNSAVLSLLLSGLALYAVDIQLDPNDQGYVLFCTTKNVRKELQDNRGQIVLALVRAGGSPGIFSALTMLRRYNSDVNVNIVDEQNATIAHYLLRSSNPDVSKIGLLEELIKRKADFTKKDKNLQTPLDYLAQKGDASLLNIVLSDSTLMAECEISRHDSEQIPDFLERIPVNQADKLAVVFSHSDNLQQNNRIMHRVLDLYGEKDIVTEQDYEDMKLVIAAYHASLLRNQTRDMSGFGMIYSLMAKLASNINLKVVADFFFQYSEFVKAQDADKKTPAHVFVEKAALGIGAFCEILYMFQKHDVDFTGVKDVMGNTVWDCVKKKTYELLQQSLIQYFLGDPKSQSLPAPVQPSVGRPIDVNLFFSQHGVKKKEDVTVQLAVEFLKEQGLSYESK